jgi:polyhydroxybutyrate depolymerase
MGDAVAHAQIPNLGADRRVMPVMYAKLSLALAAAALAAPSPAGAAYQAGVNDRTVELDGVDREYIVYVPPNVSRPAPVVFMFHGSSGTGRQFLNSSGWREQADREGFVAVFPTGLRYLVLESGRRVTKWNDFTLAAEIDGEPADDVGFVDLMLADLTDELPIDTRRIYASGFSNGASFAARLTVDRSTVFAAAAYSGGGLDGAHPVLRSVPTSVTVGTRDDRILEGTGLAELPLDPFEILASPVVRPFLDGYLETFDLDPGLYGALVGQQTTRLRWPGTDPVFSFGMIGGLSHRWPDQLVPEFWDFFREHPRGRA